MYFFGAAGIFFVGAVCPLAREDVFSDAREVFVVLLAILTDYVRVPTPPRNDAAFGPIRAPKAA
jgi:hypothetical protein